MVMNFCHKFFKNLVPWMSFLHVIGTPVVMNFQEPGSMDDNPLAD